MDSGTKIVYGILAGILAYFLLTNYFERTVPPQTNLTCNDGWNSPSIGVQGACSHHHGVMQMTPHDKAVADNQIIDFLSGLAGLYAILQTIVWINRYEAKKHSDAWEAKHGQSPSTIHEVVQSAIRWRKTIEFDYQKKRGEAIERRRIKPKQFVSYKRRHGEEQVCVEGFCLTRNADRTFALEKMSNVKTI